MTDYNPPKEPQPPIDLSHHYSITAKLRKASPIKEFYKYFQIPNISNLAGGLPNNNYFPFDTLEASAALPDRFKPTPAHPVEPPSNLRAANDSNNSRASQIVVPKVSDSSDLLKKIDVKSALQYGQAQGYPPLYAWIRNFTRKNLHPNVPYKDGPEVCMTVGNTDGFSKTIESLMNVWREGEDPISQRQGMLVEEYFYSPPAIVVRPWKVNVVPVGVDEEGMRASGKGGLEDVLENWDYSKGQRPHVIYTVTMGQNPTSGLLSVERRKAIYAICVKYDVLIVEDDPYWYLQYPSATSAEQQNYNIPNSSGYKFLDSLVPSYLSVDYEGRVVRLDTFSKTVAPGCRLGWITAQPALIEKILMYTQTSTQQPSGFVQSMIAQLVMGPDGSLPPAERTGFFGSSSASKQQQQKGWKVDGWVRWLEGLRGNYERRMQTMCHILDEGKYLVKTGRRPSLEGHLADLNLSSTNGADDPDADADSEWRMITRSSPLYTFLWPRGGMFIWLQMEFSSHPLAARRPFGTGRDLTKRAYPAGASASTLALAPSNHMYVSKARLLPHPTLAKALWVFLTHKPHLVLVSPGAMFSASPEIARERGWRFFRICFAAVDEEEIEGIARRFVGAVHRFWAIRDADTLEKWAGEAPGLLEAAVAHEGEGCGAD